MQDVSEEILTKAAKGDIPSFEAVYRAAAGFVYNVAYRIVNNREDAQEVAQEVFLNVYRQLKGFHFSSSFKTWVYRITVNCAINFARKEAKNKTMQGGRPSAEEAASGDMPTRINQEHRCKIVDDILSFLNPEQRACVVLRSMEGFSYRQIAQALRININTVRSRLKRAREKLLAHRKKAAYEHL